MGRKYRALKEALKANPERSLLVVNDRKIRLKAVAEAEAIRKKIEKLDQDHDNFVTQDQRLFYNWYELTFRPEQQELQDRQHEYNELATFHNDILATAEMRNLLPHQAYLYLLEERQRYEAGTPQERAHIEKLRQERMDFTSKAIEEEFGQYDDDDDFDDDDNPFAPPGDEGFFHREPDLSSLNKSEKKIYQDLKAKSVDKLRGHFTNSSGEYLAMEALGIATITEDPRLFLKIWEALPANVRRQVSTQFEIENGEPIQDFVDVLRAGVDIEEGKNPFFEEVPADANAEGAEHFFRVPQDKILKVSGQEEQELKSVFRRLVRLIHPDSHAAEADNNLQIWSRKIWQRVQDAYQHKNLSQLKRLEVMTMIELKKLESLTLDEIKASSHWLLEELSQLQAKAKSMKSHPAWKFSTKRTYDSLIKKIRKDFAANLSPLLADIEELKETHQMFSQIAKNWRPPPPKKKNRKKSARKTRRGRSATHDDPEQMSFM